MLITSIVAFVLVIIGALNWLLVGLFGFNFVSWLLGVGTFWSAAVYTLVGLAGLYVIFYCFAYKPFSRLNG